MAAASSPSWLAVRQGNKDRADETMRIIKKERLEFPWDEFADWGLPSHLEAATYKLERSSQSIVSETYAQVNIQETFHQLIECTDLLRVAIAHAENSGCSAPILQCSANYQKLVHDSTDLSAEIVDNSLQALNQHMSMMKRLNRKSKTSVEKALEGFAEIAPLAVAMSEKAKSVSESAEALGELAAKGLVQAQEETHMNEKQKAEVLSALNQLAADRARHETMIKSYEEDIKDEKEAEDKAAKAAEKERNKQFAIQLLSAGAGCIMTAATPVTAARSAMTMRKPAGTSDIEEVAMVAEQKANLAAEREKKRQLDGEITALERQKELLVQQQKAKKETVAESKPETKDVEKAKTQAEAAEPKTETKDDKAKTAKTEDDSVTREILEMEAKIEVLKQQRDAADQAQKALQGIATAAGERANTLDEKEKEHADARRELQKAKRESDAELAKTLATLDAQKLTHTELDRVINCLMVVVRILGQVTTTFRNVHLFWQGTVRHCQMLGRDARRIVEEGKAAIEDAKEDAGDVAITDDELADILKSEIGDMIRNSGVHWIVLGALNNEARKAITHAKDHVNGLMVDLPSKANPESIVRADAMLKQTSQRIGERLKLEDVTEA